MKGTIDYFEITIFTYPTLAECCKICGAGRHQSPYCVINGIT
jgi:hypothetical protein